MPLHPRRIQLDFIIDYDANGWYAMQLWPGDARPGFPLYISSGRLIYAVWFVESLQDEWRGEAAAWFIETLDETAAIAA